MSYSKYRNKKVMIGGIKFDSQKEAHRYLHLRTMERAGIIYDLQLQKKYVLIPKQQGERECSYIADFVYKLSDTDKEVVEDVKASCMYKTEVYKIKRKLMLYVHGIKIKEVY